MLSFSLESKRLRSLGVNNLDKIAYCVADHLPDSRLRRDERLQSQLQTTGSNRPSFLSVLKTPGNLVMATFRTVLSTVNCKKQKRQHRCFCFLQLTCFIFVFHRFTLTVFKRTLDKTSGVVGHGRAPNLLYWEGTQNVIDDRETDCTTEKCVVIGRIACTAKAILPKSTFSVVVWPL